MKIRYLNKETVSYKFKWEVLTLSGYDDLNLDERKKLWKIYLLHLGTKQLISKHSIEHWIYPEKILKDKKN